MSDAATEFKPNLEKLRKLQQQAGSILIGGKGVPRRKKKVVHKTAVTDEKKLQSSLKKLGCNQIPGIDEVNMFKETGEVIHFVNPKVQASLASNVFAISGNSETKQLSDLLPTIMSQLGPENLMSLKDLAKNLGVGAESRTTAPVGGEDEEIPQLVENFDEAAAKSEEKPAEAAPAAEPAAQA